MRDLKVETVSTTSLKPRPGNPRTHSKKQIRQIADSIRTFGWTNPILIDNDGGVVAGHGRLAAAMLIGMEEVPVIRLSAMTPAQVRAYVIADNKLAENAGWDRDLLRIELQGLLDMDLDFDIGVIGCSPGRGSGIGALLPVGSSRQIPFQGETGRPALVTTRQCLRA